MCWRPIINPSVQPVEHRPDQSRFVVNLGDEQAVMTYKLLANKGIDFDHTYVPKSARGTGIADNLVKTGLGWARENGFHIQASCWYVRLKMR